MIAVTGSTGRLGSRIAARLAERGVPQRLIVRDVARAPKLPGAEPAQVQSFGDAVGMGRALAGVDTLFLISAKDKFGMAQGSPTGEAPAYYDRFQQQATAVDAAAAVGVKHIIYLSALGAAEDSTFVMAIDHYRTEQHIRAAGVDFTFLRMTLYADHVPIYVSDDGVIRAPAGQGRAAWVTRDDIADAAVAVLTSRGHEGKTYDLTGPEALTLAESAERLTEACGKKITYQPLTPHEARTERKVSGFEKYEAERIARTGTGFGPYDVEVLVTHFMQIAVGEADVVSGDVARLAGRPGQTLADYLKNYPQSWRHLVEGGPPWRG